MLDPAQQQAWVRDGFLVLPGFKSAAECAGAIARAHALVEAFDPTQGASRFSTRDRGLVADAKLIASADQVHCFFEEEALDDAGRLLVPSASRMSPCNALTELGTSRMFSTRRSAVTVMVCSSPTGVVCARALSCTVARAAAATAWRQGALENRVMGTPVCAG